MATISETATQHGFGRDPWKWVSGLTREERARVRAGNPVWFAGRPCNDSPSGWRVAIYRHGRYIPRCPRNLGLPAEPYALAQ